jgi:hypothetical protein
LIYENPFEDNNLKEIRFADGIPSGTFSLVARV